MLARCSCHWATGPTAEEQRLGYILEHWSEDSADSSWPSLPQLITLPAICWRSPADGVTGLGGLTVQAHCLSGYSHYPPPHPPAQLSPKALSPRIQHALATEPLDPWQRSHRPALGALAMCVFVYVCMCVHVHVYVWCKCARRSCKRNNSSRL